jgi:hypothetical protein
MNKSQAESAIAALKGFKGGALKQALNSYFAGHDAKHRSASAAYGANFTAATGDEPQGFYQAAKSRNVKIGEEMKDVMIKHAPWGPKKGAVETVQRLVPIYKTEIDYADLDEKQETELLQALIASGSKDFYAAGENSFKWVIAPIPQGYAGFRFAGGGKAFPKKYEGCDVSVLVLTAGVVQLITHYPSLASSFANQTKLS